MKILVTFKIKIKGVNFYDIGLEKDFLKKTQKIHTINEKKLIFISLTSSKLKPPCETRYTPLKTSKNLSQKWWYMPVIC
jgi:hypothetical protein